jgi:two-component system response regulator
MNDRVILLVEDNADDEALTIRALMKNNIKNEVVVARDGPEALDYLFGRRAYEGRDVSVLPQIVLLDLNLPKLDGLQVLRAIRGDDRTKRLPVVILTSSKQESDLVTGYDLGANSYVRKPVDFNAFAEAVRTLGLYWLILNESPPERNGPSA